MSKKFEATVYVRETVTKEYKITVDIPDDVLKSKDDEKEAAEDYVSDLIYGDDENKGFWEMDPVENPEGPVETDEDLDFIEGHFVGEE